MRKIKYICAAVISFLLLSASLPTVEAKAVVNVARINETYYSTFASAVSASISGDTIYVLEDTSLSSRTNITKNLTITSEPNTTKTLIRGFTGDFFNVSGNSTLTLENITIDGLKSDYTNNTGPLVSISGTASTFPVLTMEEGAALQNNRSVNGAAAIQVAGYGTFNMNGGLISGNETTYGI